MDQIKESKIKVDSMRMSDLLVSLRSGKLQVPRFQRDFVWSVSKTRALLDSIYKEFPIGSFFLWRVPADHASMIKPRTELGFPPPPPHESVLYILDGQQRLTSLYCVLSGLKLGSRDYGRVCLDIEAAKRYDARESDDYDGDDDVDENGEPRGGIFVYRAPDEKRFLSVSSVFSGDWDLFEPLDPEDRPIVGKAGKLLREYPFSVVLIQEQTFTDAIQIFQRINQGGKRLSRFDLICANVWTESFDLRKRVESHNGEFKKRGFGELDVTIYTQALALLAKESCRVPQLMSLETEELRSWWSPATAAIERAVSFASSELGVKRANCLPYRGIIPVLAYVLHHAPSSTLDGSQTRILWEWFWRVSLSERYSSTSPARMEEDCRLLRDMFDGAPVRFPYAPRLTPEAVARTRMTSTASAIRNAFLCMLNLRGPRNIKSGSRIALSDEYYSELTRAERHHVFPYALLRRQGRSLAAAQSIANFCYLPADLNKEISDDPPSQYLTRYRRSNAEFTDSLGSQLLSVAPDSGLWSSDYDAFIAERSCDIADALLRLVDVGSSAVIAQASALKARLDQVENDLRDAIHGRLVSDVGEDYWSQTIPSDVIHNCRLRTKERLDHNPQLRARDLAGARQQLDFCDVSDYERILLSNWGTFQSTFRNKSDVQKHMSSFRNLRNCVAHSREPTTIERKMGEAALIWLEGVLSRELDDELLELEYQEEVQ